MEATMNEELDEGARDFIARALREEPRADATELRRIKTRVVATALAVTSAGGAAQAASLAGKSWLAVVSTPLVKAIAVGSLTVGGAATLAVTLPSQRGGSATEASQPAEPGLSRVRPVVPKREPAVEALLPSEVVAPAPVVALLPSAPVSAGRAEPAPLSAAPKTSGDTPAVAVSDGKARPSLSEELVALRAAQARLNAGDGKGALRLLDETALALGGGQLAVERRAVEILAACKAGELQRADRLAREFLKAHPDAPAAARVRSSCVGEGL
jgi:hypothetical protein